MPVFSIDNTRCKEHNSRNLYKDNKLYREKAFHQKTCLLRKQPLYFTWNTTVRSSLVKPLSFDECLLHPSPHVLDDTGPPVFNKLNTLYERSFFHPRPPRVGKQIPFPKLDSEPPGLCLQGISSGNMAASPQRE